VSSFDEVRVQKKLVKEGKIEVVENPRFMMDARPKELERRQRKISLFPHHHHRSESHAAAIQQPAVKQFRVCLLDLFLRPKALLLPKLPILLQTE